MTRLLLWTAVVLFLGVHQAAAQSAPDGPACRNIPTSLTHVTVAQGGFSSTLNQTCKFDREAFRGSCTNQYSDNRGASNVGSTTVVATYPSVGAFIDEVRVVPPLFKALSAAATSTGPGGRNSSTTFTYDSQGRLIKEVTAGSPATTTYTEWDAAGRPTRVKDVGPGFNNTRVVSYDDMQRTRTTKVIPEGRSDVVVTTVETFDADGNPIRQVASGGPSTSTTTIAINNTQRVCR
jgi:YD repeat-containing protein